MDDELIAQIAAGDREAFGELYRRHRAQIHRFATHMCGSASLAEDIVHDTFVAVIHSAQRYRPGYTSATHWLLGISRNYVRRTRTMRRWLSLHDEAHDEAGQVAADVDTAADLEQRRRVEALRRAVVALPLRYREAVVLCDLHEFSYAEAAAALRCAIGTVRSRLHRGRALLARRLCGRQQPDPCPLAVTRTIP